MCNECVGRDDKVAIFPNVWCRGVATLGGSIMMVGIWIALVRRIEVALRFSLTGSIDLQGSWRKRWSFS